MIRPFASIDAVDECLVDVRLLINGIEYEHGAVVLDEEVLAAAHLTVRLPDVQRVKGQVAKTNVSPVDCGLVVLGSARSHRIAQVFVQEYLSSGSWPSELVLDRASADLVLRDLAGFTLTVAVVLLHDLQPEPLRPHMAGTWLARREFNVSLEREDTSFSPEELTDEIRVHHQLPQGVMRFISVGDWQDADLLSDEVHVYVDSEVLNLLLADPAEPSAVQMQIELALQATETVASTIAREVTEVDVSPSDSSLDSYPAAKRFFEIVARNVSMSIAQCLTVAAEEPAILRAHLEAAFSMRAATSAALKEK